MSVRLGLVLPAMGVAVALLLALQLRGLAAAGARRAQAEALLAGTVSMVGERARLQAAREEVSAGRRPEQDVIARVNAALGRAGVDPGAFRGQQPEADARLPRPAAGDGPLLRRQSVRLSLASLTPSQLGRFLEAWRSDHPMWSPVRIDLVRRQGDGKSGEDDPPGRYDATVVVAAIYIDAVDGGAPGVPGAPASSGGGTGR